MHYSEKMNKEQLLEEQPNQDNISQNDSENKAEITMRHETKQILRQDQKTNEKGHRIAMFFFVMITEMK